MQHYDVFDGRDIMVGRFGLSFLSTRLGIFFLSVPIIFFFVLLVFLLAGEDHTGLITDIASPLFSSTAAVLAFMLYWYDRKTPFRDIGLGFAVAFSVIAIAETIFSASVEVFSIEPRASIADLFWISGCFVLIALFAKMFRDSKSKPSRKMLGAEALYWAIMVPFLGYATYELFLVEGTDAPFMIAASIYMYGSAIILSLLIVLLASDVISELQEFRTVASVAAIFIMGGNIIYIVYDAAVGYTVGSPPDVFFVSGYLALTFGLALLVSARIKLLSITSERGVGLGVKGEQRLLPMTTYLVMGKRLQYAYDMLLTEIETGRKGIIVTRKDPESLRKDYNMRGTPIILLSTSPGNNVIPPANLGILTDTITRVMEREPEAVVLIDGIESLVTYNDFQKVLKMIGHLKDEAIVNRASLIVVVDDGKLSDKEKISMAKGAEPVLT
jgi:hypothetical protein